jgi:OmcA/MtrC family decaheme c-type cytochrome
VTFSVKDKSGKPILPSDMARLRLLLAGPTTDYPSYISEDVVRATGASDGRYFWTFQNPIPANATGSYGVGMEGYRNITLLPGKTREQTARDAGLNKQFYFSVDGSKMAPRRQVVSTAKCNNCHFQISFHGGNRNDVGECVFCHLPSGVAGTGAAAESIDFRMMIHKIHTGEELHRGYKLGNTDFARIAYPGDRRDCAACHVNGSEQLPLQAGLLPVSDPKGPLNPMGPVTAACTSCHDTVTAASHALANTTRLGESCDVCHGTGLEFSVAKVHAR